MEKLNDIIFYTIEKSIKAYRQFAQHNIAKEGIDITIDQWLVLKTIQEDRAITQQQLALKVFKDNASITRIIELLVNKGYLLRNFHSKDRRRFSLILTKAGTKTVEMLERYSKTNRSRALKGLTAEDIEILHSILLKIISNVSNKTK